MRPIAMTIAVLIMLIGAFGLFAIDVVMKFVTLRP